MTAVSGLSPGTLFHGNNVAVLYFYAGSFSRPIRHFMTVVMPFYWDKKPNTAFSHKSDQWDAKQIRLAPP